MGTLARNSLLIFLIASITLACTCSLHAPGRAASTWMVSAGDSFPITITKSVETAGNGTRSIRQTGTLQVVTHLGSSQDYPACGTCGGACLILNRSKLAVEWDPAWFATYDHYNAADEHLHEISLQCSITNDVPAKVLTAANWDNLTLILKAYSDALKAQAQANGATDYLGSVTGSTPTVELTWSYSNGTDGTGVERSGKITYTHGILAKLVFNEVQIGPIEDLAANAVTARSEKWTMGDQGAAIPGFPSIAFLGASVMGVAVAAVLHRKRAARVKSEKKTATGTGTGED